MQHVVYIPHGTKLLDFLLITCITDWRKVGQFLQLSFGKGCRQAALQLSRWVENNIQSRFIYDCITSMCNAVSTDRSDLLMQTCLSHGVMIQSLPVVDVSVT